ncbi:MAG TPA: TonB-dependent receptor [Vicinamibacterales bacterium]|nr:TonB-dependent receptor [Vicinamibacterales bacterium]
MLVRTIGLLSLAALMAAPVSAQQYRARLRGTVVDPAGAPAPGIPLRMVSESTGESRVFTSDDNGRYTVTGLLPGTYRIAADDERYRTFAVRTSLSVNQDLELDLRLGIVPISVGADLRPAAVPIDRHSPALTTRVDPSLITKLPLDGRNYLDLALLAPGVMPGFQALASNGTSDLSTGYLLDGIYDIEARLGRPAARPALDAISELEVRTSTYDVSFGRAAGAQVNVVTKSGTNRAAGGAFAFVQSDGDRSQLGGFAGGPLAENRTFLFGNYQHSRAGDAAGTDEGGHLLGGRLDHIFNGSSRITARYGLDDGGAFDRRGQNVGVSFHHVPASAVTNELRFGVARVDVGDLTDVIGVESQSFQLANMAMWSKGQHLVSAGAEWYRLERGLVADSAGSWGLFVHDDWQALPAVSLSAGVRYDRAFRPESPAPPPEETDAGDTFSPRFGVAWTVDPAGQTLVRGGYGVHHDYDLIRPDLRRVDHWTASVLRRIGYARTVEAAYVATRGSDVAGDFGTSRYDAMQLKLDQRSESGNTVFASYTYGKWTEELGDADRVPSPLDARHRLTLAFIAALPFGVERRWFSEGVAATILGGLELSGAYTLQSGYPDADIPGEEGADHRSLDLALLKNLDLGDRRGLQLRIETFNLTDRTNRQRGRRYQFGGRFLF